MIVEVFRADPTNVGDWHCRPGRYVDYHQPTRVADIWTVSSLAPTDSAVVGGGGLFSASFPQLERLVREHPSQTVLWGVGHNLTVDVARGFVPPTDLSLPSWTGEARLVGVRDFGTRFEWVPCASCLHESFDTPAPAQHDVVLFEHKRVPTGISGLPTMTNEGASLAETLAFLASGETVLTNSYHGAYWALLLGRRVVAFPFSSKFYGFKHKVTLCPAAEWRTAIAGAVAHPEALEECRAANLSFGAKVMDVVHSAPLRRARPSVERDPVARTQAWLTAVAPEPIVEIIPPALPEPHGDDPLVRYVTFGANASADAPALGGAADLGTSGQDGALPVVVCFFTKDTPYEQEAERLRRSCIDARVDYVIEGIEARGNWVWNCAIKAEFCLRQWRELRRPILWVDADATVLQRPRLLASADVDVALHKWKGWEIVSGTIFFNATPLAGELLEEWVRRCQDRPEVWDQKHLEAAWRAVNARTALRTLWLPRSYCRIFDAPDIPGEIPVIVHHQASRRLKQEVSTVDVPDVSVEREALVRELTGEVERVVSEARLAIYRERMSELAQRMAMLGVRECHVYGTGEAGRELAAAAVAAGIIVHGLVRTEGVLANETVDGHPVRSLAAAARTACHAYAIGSFGSGSAMLASIEAAYAGRKARYQVHVPIGPAPIVPDPAPVVARLTAALS